MGRLHDLLMDKCRSCTKWSGDPYVGCVREGYCPTAEMLEEERALCARVKELEEKERFLLGQLHETSESCTGAWKMISQLEREKKELEEGVREMAERMTFAMDIRWKAGRNLCLKEGLAIARSLLEKYGERRIDKAEGSKGRGIDGMASEPPGVGETP